MGLFNDVVNGFVNGFVAGATSGNGVSASPSPQGVAVIERLCRELGWSIDERIGDKGISLHFRDPLVNVRQVLITCGGMVASICTFSAASMPASRVPTEILGYLLTRNRELTTAAWQVMPSDDGNASFVVGYCALLGGLDAHIFKYICETQVKEVHAFDSKMQAAGLLRN